MKKLLVLLVLTGCAADFTKEKQECGADWHMVRQGQSEEIFLKCAPGANEAKVSTHSETVLPNGTRLTYYYVRSYKSRDEFMVRVEDGVVVSWTNWEYRP